MKLNQWTMALASAGVVSLASTAHAEEAMSQVLTAVSSTTLSGYVDTGAIWKPGTGGNDNLPGRFNDGAGKMDGFNLNVVSLTLEKPLGEENWAAGYQVQLLYGPDAVAYNPSANLTAEVVDDNGNGTIDPGESVSGSLPSDFGVKNANVTVRFPMGNGLDLKMGVFDTIIGYEVFDSYLNPNFGRSYGWSLEPTQHTGGLLSYQVTENFGLAAGIANTLMPGVNTRSPRAESHKTYMGSLVFTAPDSWGWMSGSAFYAGVVDGFAGNAKDTVNTYVGLSVPMPIEGMSIGTAFDYRNNGSNDVTGPRNWAYAWAGYLTMEATEKLTLSGRIDWSAGSNGTWWTSGRFNVDTGNFDARDNKNELLGITLTADYALWENVLARGEVRWDTSLTGDEPFGPANAPEKNAVSLAANLVYIF